MEIALVTKGEGEVQIVYPNGTAAATERVQEGTVFYVPQNFPMCQIASRSGPLEFIGFSTSSKPNNPQFLAGKFVTTDLIIKAMYLVLSFENKCLLQPNNGFLLF
jgi:hypothetical protein